MSIGNVNNKYTDEASKLSFAQKRAILAGNHEVQFGENSKAPISRSEGRAKDSFSKLLDQWKVNEQEAKTHEQTKSVKTVSVEDNNNGKENVSNSVEEQLPEIKDSGNREITDAEKRRSDLDSHKENIVNTSSKLTENKPLGDSKFRNVHGGIFKKLDSFKNKVGSAFSKEVNQVRQQNAKNYADMIDALEGKYGKGNLPKSLYDKRDKALKNGRDAQVTHGTLERAEKYIEECMQKCKEIGYEYHPATNDRPAFWGRSLLSIFEDKSKAISELNKFYGARSVGREDNVIEANENGITVFYEKIDKLVNGGWKKEYVELTPPISYKWDEMEVRPRTSEYQVNYGSRVKFIESFSKVEGEKNIKFEYISDPKVACGNNPMLDF